MAGSVVGAVAGGLASGAISSIFGGGGSVAAPLQRPPFQPFDFGGLSGRLRDGRVVITPGEERSTAIGEVQRLLREEADQIAGLRDLVRPGFGELTAARLAEIENRRSRAVGNLRESLARRRVQGSSFANNALIRAEAEFAQESAEARAVSFLQELEATTDFITREAGLRQRAVERGIDELNFQSQLGAQLITGVNAELGANARLQSELAAEAQQNIGAFFEPAITGIQDFVGRLFGPGGAITESGAV